MKDKPIVDLREISFSGISMYLRCSRMYYFRYVKGLKEPPKIALLEGSSHHEALQKNNLHKKKTGRDLKAKQVTDSFMDSLRARAKQSERLDWEGESEDKLYSRAKVWHNQYIGSLAPKIKPNWVEQEFTKPVKDGNFTLKGVIDLTYEKRCSDYKTASANSFSRRKREIGSDLQLSIYSYATGLREVENICFIKKDNPEIGVIRAIRGQKAISWALRVAGEVAKAISARSFPMTNPTNWVCSELYCGYWKFCRGADPSKKSLL